MSKAYNPVDVCHHCHDRMYEYLKQKIHEKIDHWEGHGISLDLDSNDVVDVLKSLLENK